MVKKKLRKRASRRKPAAELDDVHALQRIFPKEIRDEIKRQAREADRQREKGSSQ